jgi:solute carrier family 12 sodium/potassium/chloride transporter 2
MAALLAKFRITYSDLTVIKDVKQAPKESTRAWFDGLIRDFYGRDQLPGIQCTTRKAQIIVIAHFNFLIWFPYSD